MCCESKGWGPQVPENPAEIDCRTFPGPESMLQGVERSWITYSNDPRAADITTGTVKRPGMGSCSQWARAEALFAGSCQRKTHFYFQGL